MTGETQFTKECRRAGCAFRGIKVRVGKTAKTCVGCGGPLESDAQAFMEHIEATQEQRKADFVEQVLDIADNIVKKKQQDR